MSIAKVSAGRGWLWIKEGVGMVLEEPMVWIGGFAIFIGLQIVLSFIPVLGVILTQLLGFGASVYFLAFAQAQRLDLDFNSDQIWIRCKEVFPRCFFLSLISIGIFAVCAIPVLVSLVLAGGTEFFTAQMKGTAFAISPGSMGTVAFGGMLSAVLATAAASATMFATPQIILQDRTIKEALQNSLKAVVKNLLPLFVYAVLLSLLFFVSMLPLFLGLLVFFPVISTSYYIAFDEMLGQLASDVVE